jgi:hypothetical protein
MAQSENHEHWKQLKREARARIHVSDEHAAWLLAGILDACEKILLATDMITDPNRKLVFIDELFTAVRRTVSVGETMEQLEFTARAIWEKRHAH